jgi:hypothetical protein
MKLNPLGRIDGNREYIMGQLTEEEYTNILNAAELMAINFIQQFTTLPPNQATSLQLGMVIAIATVWASAANENPVDLISKIMGTMPPVLKGAVSKYVN